jgi:hypothetical protein
MLRIPQFLDNQLADDIEAVDLTCRPPFTPRKILGVLKKLLVESIDFILTVRVLKNLTLLRNVSTHTALFKLQVLKHAWIYERVYFMIPEGLRCVLVIRWVNLRSEAPQIGLVVG